MTLTFDELLAMWREGSVTDGEFIGNLLKVIDDASIESALDRVPEPLVPKLWAWAPGVVEAHRTGAELFQLGSPPPAPPSEASLVALGKWVDRRSERGRSLGPSDLASIAEVDPERRAAHVAELARRIVRGASPHAVHPAIVEALARESDSRTFGAWLDWIAAAPSLEFLPALVRIATCPDVDFRRRAVDLVRELDSPEVDRILLAIVESDPESRVRRRAVKHLVRRAIEGKWTEWEQLRSVRAEDWLPGAKREFQYLLQRRDDAV